MFNVTPRVPITRSRASPFTPTPQGSSFSQSKRISGLFTPKRRKVQGNRSSLQTSQVLDEAAQHRVESYGVPLPVLITEALTLADRSTEITVKIDPSGWAWLVGGRKLFVWRFKPGPTTRSVLCKELTLPPSDLAHNASRVCVIPSGSDSQSASCVAVSPEGVVRYWPNIAYETSSIEISAELKGEECACVINFPPYGCLLATTTSSLVLLAPVPGQNTLACHPLKGTQGMFAGIGRRMSSFIFGASPAQTSGAPLQAIVPGEMEEDERPFYVLSGTMLQKWIMTDGNMEKVLYQVDADRMFREALAKKIWDQDSLHLTELKTWLLDMQLTRDGVMVLGAGVNLEVDSNMHYAVAIINTESSGTPSGLENLTVLDYIEKYEEHNELQLLSYQLLVPDQGMGAAAYIYDKQKVLIAPVSSAQPMEVQSVGSILGAGSCDSVAVFFSSSMGLFSVSGAQPQEFSILEESGQDVTSYAEVSALFASTTQIQEMSMSEDKSARLKAAFILACGGNVQKAQSIIEELFPGLSTGSGHMPDLDRLVTALSRDLIDDYPASDPRWAETVRQDSTSSTTSLIILQQLKDKQKAHDLIITFLKKLYLWDRLSVVTVRDMPINTRLLLCEHAEKVEAAIFLRELHSQYSAAIDAGIRKVLDNRGELDISQSLTPQDVFYREVSRVHEIVEALMDYQADLLSGDLSTAGVIGIVSTVNAVLEGMLNGGLQYRQSKAAVFQGEADGGPCPEYIPWTSTAGKHGIRTLLLKQYALTMEQAIPEVQDVETQGALFQQLLSLSDIILDGYSCQLESLRLLSGSSDRYRQLQKKYEQDRQNLITPFLAHEQYERAASLAEKYYDFEILIQLCELTNSQDRIQRYIIQFGDKGFSDFLFTWYMKEGKRGKLLSLPASQHTDLRKFLKTEDVKYLSWLHDIQTNNFVGAHDTLMDLAREEAGSLAKKKTLLSLSKLSALASEEDDDRLQTDITNVNDEQDLILHQELLPPDLIESLGMDPGNMRVLSPVELIELYVSEQNVAATEFDFKKALDLLQYIDTTDPAVDFESLRLHIWCSAIHRDSWSTQTSDPLQDNKDTIFFKTVDLAYKQGSDLQEFLPHVDVLLNCEELGPLKTNPTFQYLMRAGYEHIKSILG